MSVPYRLFLRRSKASATGVAYIKNEAMEDFTTTSTSNSISETYYHKQYGGVTLLLGSTCIVDKTNSDGTTSTLNSNYYSGFKYPSFNSKTREYTGYDINFYIPTLYSLDLTKSATYYFLTSANWKATAPYRLLYATSIASGGHVTTSSHYCNDTQLGVNTTTVDNYNFVVAGKSKFSGEVYVDGNKVIINDTYYPSFELRAKTANSASTYSSAQFECNYTDNAGMWIWSDYTDSTKSRRGLILYGYKSGRDSNNCVALRQCDAKGTWLNDLYLLHSGNYSNYALPISGGTLTGSLIAKSAIMSYPKNSSWIYISHNGALQVTSKPTAQSAQAICSLASTNGSWGMATLYGNDNLYFVYGSDANYKADTNTTSQITFGSGGQVYGAVWNDYAEYRQASIKEPGRCVVEKGDDTLELSTARLLPGANIVSDTFGFAIGETKDCTTPIAISGRVLAYPYEPRDQFKAGNAVCSGPNGTVSIMTREEIKEYPERIIGTVSSVPTYERWGSGNVLVDGRVWIKV